MYTGTHNLVRQRCVLHHFQRSFPDTSTGLPEIRKDVRVMTNEHFQTTAAIAAFLSGVTATILQVTNEQVDTPLKNAVNVLLFSSLLFSVMSGINSLLFIKWYQSGRCVPSHLSYHPLLRPSLASRLRCAFPAWVPSSATVQKHSWSLPRPNLLLQSGSFCIRQIRCVGLSSIYR